MTVLVVLLGVEGAGREGCRSMQWMRDEERWLSLLCAGLVGVQFACVGISLNCECIVS